MINKISKSKKEINYISVASYLESKGFKILEIKVEKKQGAYLNDFSLIRCGHKKLDSLNKDQTFISELLLYFSPSNKNSFFFHIALSVNGEKDQENKIFIPFFGRLHWIARRYKQLASVTDEMQLIYDNIDYLEYILDDLNNIFQNTKEREKFLKSLPK